MVVRTRRKKNKLRGMRQHGAGDKKNRRGAGSRGGRGKAGSHKHKFSKYYTYFGIKRTRKAKDKVRGMNLEEISINLQKWIESGKAKKQDGMVVIDCVELGIGKVLGKGQVFEKLKIVNGKVSKQAEQKITAAGGIAAGEALAEDGFEEEEDVESGDEK